MDNDIQRQADAADRELFRAARAVQHLAGMVSGFEQSSLLDAHAALLNIQHAVRGFMSEARLAELSKIAHHAKHGWAMLTDRSP